jgi:hypothetical protein
MALMMGRGYMMFEENDLPEIKVNVIERAGSTRKQWINCRIGEHLQLETDDLASYFFAQWEPIVFDLLLLAAAVEFCDKVKKRPKLGWGRSIHLYLPVHEVSVWQKASVGEELVRALELLTGDRWQIEFVQRKTAALGPPQGMLPLEDKIAVIPFSEGLDSRAVAGLMSQELGAGLVRVRLGPKESDRQLDDQGRVMPFRAVPYKISSGVLRFPETSARSRGFKFAILSGIAPYLANVRRVIVPESGQGALGPSLVTVGQSHDDFRNHPVFTSQISSFLRTLLGVTITYEFPRLWYTKGQTLQAYTAHSGSRDWKTTRSCWQDNRHASVEGKRRQCGICAACMLRRLSVHAAGLEEDKGIYLWENLGAESLDAAAPAGLKRIETAQRHYALAGTLHLDHLAWLKKSPLGASVIQTNVVRLAESLKKPAAEVQSNLDSLLSQHEKEWKSFVISLPPASFVRRWTVLQ